MNDISIYNKIPDPIDAVSKLGTAIGKGGIIKCPGGDRGIAMGRCIALILLQNQISLLDFARMYHVFPNGQLSMKADYMLAAVQKHKWTYRLVQRDEDGAVVEYTRKHRGKEDEVHTFSLTWEEAQAEKWPWTDGSKKKLKDNWATPRGRMVMMWHRVNSDAIGALCPEVNAGVPSESEAIDFIEDVVIEADGEVEIVAAKEPETVDAEFESKPVPEEKPETKTTDGEGKITAGQIDSIKEYRSMLSFTKESWQEYVALTYRVKSIKEMTRLQAIECIQDLQKKHDEQPEHEVLAENEVDTAAIETVAMIESTQVDRLKELAKELKLTKDDLPAYIKKFNAASLRDLTFPQAEQLIGTLEKELRKKNETQDLDNWGDEQTGN